MIATTSINLSKISLLLNILSNMDQFGKQRLQDFYIDPTYINVNHGSYGASPKTVMAHKREF